MEKVQFNSINKKQNGLKYSKNDKSSTLPCPTENYLSYQWVLEQQPVLGHPYKVTRTCVI